MKKEFKIIFIVLGVIVSIIVLDTLQAKLLNHSPLFKVRLNLDGGGTDYIDKGFFVNHFYCANHEEKTLFKSAKYTCPLKELESEKEYDEEYFKCLESALGGYLVTEKDDLIEIPLSEIKKNGTDQILYYKGAYASLHAANRYMLVYPKDGIYENNITKEIDAYFYNQYGTYQTYMIPSGPILYVHNSNLDVSFSNILKMCTKKNPSLKETEIPSSIPEKLKETKKIIIQTDGTEIGAITDTSKIQEIQEAIASGKRYGDVCLADNYRFTFLLYDSENHLLDTLYVWNDGNRIGTNETGCYFHVTNGFDFKKLIEEETDFTFYTLIDFREEETDNLQFLYQENQNRYYIKSANVSDIRILFLINNQIMSLQSALEKKYISAEKVASDYPDILIKK